MHLCKEKRLGVLRQCTSALILRVRMHSNAYNALPCRLTAPNERLTSVEVIGWEWEILTLFD
eukprot:4155355-Pyramimonas_sp.AAC.1